MNYQPHSVERLRRGAFDDRGDRHSPRRSTFTDDSGNIEGKVVFIRRFSQATGIEAPDDYIDVSADAPFDPEPDVRSGTGRPAIAATTGRLAGTGR
jgi:hypothetical protein